jgi:hypothetical protein
MSKPCLWLRCEKKEFERRAALSPNTAKALIDNGFDIFVERDEQRIFKDGEYESSVLYPGFFTLSSVVSGSDVRWWTITLGHLLLPQYPSSG